MTLPRVLAEKNARIALNGTSLRSAKARPWFWIHEQSAAIIGSLGMSRPRRAATPMRIAMRIRGQKSPKNASELWIT
jgi:hypothetical protein